MQLIQALQTLARVHDAPKHPTKLPHEQHTSARAVITGLGLSISQVTIAPISTTSSKLS